jgi:hypothetical protein
METDDYESVFQLREHQTMDTHLAPNGYANETYMAPAYDLYDQYSPFGRLYLLCFLKYSIKRINLQFQL